MDLIKIEGKSVEKLIDVVSKGIGTLYKPRAIRKEADAEAYKAEVLAKAEAKRLIIEGEAKIELYERAKERLLNQEINRQVNIEDIVEKSIEYLEDSISDTPVDDDWRTRFFKKAQDVSNEEMQDIWAKILAGEVSNPGRISFRTLEVISNLSKSEAEIFQIACSLSSNCDRIYKLSGQNALDDFGLNYNHLLMLRDSGLLHDSDSLQTILKIIPEAKGSILIIGDKHYYITNSKNTTAQDYRFQQIAFTVAGKEICSLLKIEKNQEYIDKLISDLKSKQYELTNLDLAELAKPK